MQKYAKIYKKYFYNVKIPKKYFKNAKISKKYFKNAKIHNKYFSNILKMQKCIKISINLKIKINK